MKSYIINTSDNGWKFQSFKVTTYLALEAIEGLDKTYGAQTRFTSTSIEDLKRGAAEYNAQFDVEEIEYRQECDYQCRIGNY